VNFSQNSACGGVVIQTTPLENPVVLATKCRRLVAVKASPSAHVSKHVFNHSFTGEPHRYNCFAHAKYRSYGSLMSNEMIFDAVRFLGDLTKYQVIVAKQNQSDMLPS
jgi:hypothetical protein